MVGRSKNWGLPSIRLDEIGVSCVVSDGKLHDSCIIGLKHLLINILGLDNVDEYVNVATHHQIGNMLLFTINNFKNIHTLKADTQQPGIRKMAWWKLSPTVLSFCHNHIGKANWRSMRRAYKRAVFPVLNLKFAKGICLDVDVAALMRQRFKQNEDMSIEPDFTVAWSRHFEPLDHWKGSLPDAREALVGWCRRRRLPVPIFIDDSRSLSFSTWSKNDKFSTWPKNDNNATPLMGYQSLWDDNNYRFDSRVMRNDLGISSDSTPWGLPIYPSQGDDINYSYQSSYYDSTPNNEIHKPYLQQVFRCSVKLWNNSEIIGPGWFFSRRVAQQTAAYTALQTLAPGLYPISPISLKSLQLAKTTSYSEIYTKYLSNSDKYTNMTKSNPPQKCKSFGHVGYNSESDDRFETVINNNNETNILSNDKYETSKPVSLYTAYGLKDNILEDSSLWVYNNIYVDKYDNIYNEEKEKKYNNGEDINKYNDIYNENNIYIENEHIIPSPPPFPPPSIRRYSNDLQNSYIK
eukprot:GHVL01031182.1.p1 GENE.GHVL01031182.1~~GHVL01031182.1.p1  ORF type:complete len:519 (-),score=141.41 GHVL01031182.1:41-1597(-)